MNLKNLIEKKKVIIDTDPGIDDALAIMFLLNSPEVDVQAITIVEGNVSSDKGAENALKILKLMGREDIPVYIGSREPLEKPYRDAEDTHGENGLGGMELEASDVEPIEGGVDYLIETLNNSPDDEYTILALGPLTNLARALEKNPKALRKAKEIVMMGGAFRSNGNCSPVAEFNVWCDPHAAAKVFEEAHIPITMVGLDVTREIVLTPNYRTLVKKEGGEIGKVIYDMTQFYEDFHWDAERTLGVVINDPLAAAVLVDPQIASGPRYYTSVITQGPAEGMTMVDSQGILKRAPNVKVLTTVNTQRFFDLFFTRLFPGKRGRFKRVLDDPRYGVME